MNSIQKFKLTILAFTIFGLAIQPTVEAGTMGAGMIIIPIHWSPITTATVVKVLPAAAMATAIMGITGGALILWQKYSEQPMPQNAPKLLRESMERKLASIEEHKV